MRHLFFRHILRPYAVATLVLAALLSTTGNAAAEVLVTNLDPSGSISNTQTNTEVAQVFRTGSNAAGYSLESIEFFYAVFFPIANTDKFNISVWTVDSNGHPETKEFDLTTPSLASQPSRSDPQVFTAPADTTLSADTEYAVVTAGMEDEVDFSLITTDTGGSSSFGFTLTVPYLVATDTAGTITYADIGLKDDTDHSTQVLRMVINSAEIATTPTLDNEIPDQEAIAGQPFSFQFAADTFSDPNGDDLVYSAGNVPTWLTFTPATRTFSGTPPGTLTLAPNEINVTATDPGGEFVQDDFKLTLFVDVPDLTAADGEVLVTNLDQIPSSDASISTGVGQAFTTGSNADGYTLGSIEIAIRRFDSTASEIEKISAGLWSTTTDSMGNVLPGVNVAALTLAGTITNTSTTRFSAPANTTLDADTSYALVLTYSGGDPTIYTVRNTDSTADTSSFGFDLENHSLQVFGTNWQVSNEGPLMMRVIGAEADASAPTLDNPIPDQTITVGELWTYTVPADTFSDPVGDGLTYTTSDLPTWLSFDADTQTFSGTPPSSFLGGETFVSVIATDTEGQSDVSTFEIVVLLVIPAVDTGDVLVANLDQIATSGVGLSQGLGQVFTTGPNAGGYTLGSIEIVFDAFNSSSTETDQLSASLYSTTTDSMGNVLPGISIATLSLAGTITNTSTTRFTAPTATSLNPNTSYAVVLAYAGSDVTTFTARPTLSDSLTSSFGFDLPEKRVVFDGTIWTPIENPLLLRVVGTEKSQVVNNCAAPDFGTREQIWSAVLTPESTGGATFWGYNPGAARGILSPDTFSIGQSSFTFTGLIGNTDTQVNIQLNNSLSLEQKNALRLHVCDEVFDFSDDTNNSNLALILIPASDVNWSDGAARNVWLSLAANNPAAGSPTITSSGTANEGDVLTASPSAITDADGLPDSFEYQWYREEGDGSNQEAIAGATMNTYTLAAADAGKRVRVRVSFRDDLDRAEERESAPWPSTGTVVPLSLPGCLVPDFGTRRLIWTATLTPEQTALALDTWGYLSFDSKGSLTPDSFSIGPTDFSFTTLNAVTDTRINIVLGTSLTVAQKNALRLHVCDAVFNLSDYPVDTNLTILQIPATDVDWTDGVARTVYLSLPANNAAAGTAPTISGTAAVSQTLTVDASGITDADGLPSSFSYQWYRENSDGTGREAIAGATMSTYRLATADAGKKILVQVEFVDLLGGEESVISAAYPATGTVGSAPTVSIRAVADQAMGSVLDARFEVTASEAPDTDLVVNLAFSRSGTQAIVPDNVNATITIPANQTSAEKDFGVRHFPDNVMLTATVEAGTGYGIALAPANTATVEVVSQSAVTVRWVANTYTVEEGEDASPMLEFALPVGFPAPRGPSPKVSIASASDTAVIFRDYPVSISARELRMPAANWNDDDNDTAYTGLLTVSAPTVEDTVREREERFFLNLSNAPGSNPVVACPDEFLSDGICRTIITITDDDPNTPASGAPTISGIPAVSFTLTADVSGITDADGLPSSFTYQWLRENADGTMQETIPGATTSTYTLAEADEGKRLRVRVEFTDRLDSEESVESAALPARGTVVGPVSCPAPDLSGRRSVWTGTVTVGDPGSGVYGYSDDAGYGGIDSSTFTIGTDNHTVKVVDVTTSTGDLNFQVRDGGALPSSAQLHVCDMALNIEDATLVEFNPFNTYTWDLSLDWSAVSVRTVHLSLAANNAAGGAPTISGTATVQQTLTADASGITDTDGLPSSFTYQWLRENEDGTMQELIPGATSSTYDLVTADVGKRVRVRVEFTDLLGGEESVDSTAYPATGTVMGLPTITIEANRTQAPAWVGNITYTLTRQGDISAEFKVNVVFTAPAGSDWGGLRCSSCTVTFNAGSATATLDKHTGSGFFGLSLSTSATVSGVLTASIGAASGHDLTVFDTTDTAEVQIDVPPLGENQFRVSFTQTAFEVEEGGGPYTITIEAVARSTEVTPPIRGMGITPLTIRGTATNPGDYQILDRSLTISSSDCVTNADGFLVCTVTQTLTIVDDTVVEPEENFILQLQTAPGLPVRAVDFVRPDGTISGTAAVTYPVTLRDNDLGLLDINVTSTPLQDPDNTGTPDTYGAREHIEFTARFNTPVDVSGMPTFTFDIGGTEVAATYFRGSGTDTLLFSHAVRGGNSGDLDDNGISWDANQLAGTINVAGTSDAALLVHAAQSNLAGHKVNGRDATNRFDTASVTGITVTSTPMLRSTGSSVDDTYGAGEDIEITVTFSQAVTVEGTPQFRFSLADSGDPVNNVDADYVRGSGTTDLVFAYTVQPADSDDDGILIGQYSSSNRDTFQLDTDDRIRVTANNVDVSFSHSQQGTQTGHKVDGSRVGNTAPTADDSTVTMDEDATYAFAAADFNFADTDPGDTLASVKITQLESAGDLQLDGADVTANQVILLADIDADRLTFRPAANANGTGYATFQFRVSDGTDESVAAYTMTIDVNAVNDAPTAANNTVMTDEDTPKVFQLTDFGFTDADAGDALDSVKVVTLPAAGQGELRLNNVPVTPNQVFPQNAVIGGQFTYTPPADANGDAFASFTFRVSDGTDESAVAYTMTIDVTSVEDAPVLANPIANQQATVGELFSFTIPADAFADSDGDTLDYQASRAGDDPLPAWLSFNDTTLTLEGTPGSGDTGTLTVEVSVTDGNAEASGTFDITVAAGTTTGTACPAPNFGTREQIWTGNMTVGSVVGVGGGGTEYGFSFDGGALDDTTFTIGTRVRNIASITHHLGGSRNNQLRFQVLSGESPFGRGGSGATAARVQHGLRLQQRRSRFW